MNHYRLHIADTFSFIINVLYHIDRSNQWKFMFLLISYSKLFFNFLNHSFQPLSLISFLLTILKNFRIKGAKRLQSNSDFMNKMFSCEFCEISKTTFFTEPLRVYAFVNIDMSQCCFKEIYVPGKFSFTEVGFQESNETKASKQMAANIYLFKFNNRNTNKRCEICWKLT